MLVCRTYSDVFVVMCGSDVFVLPRHTNHFTYKSLYKDITPLLESKTRAQVSSLFGHVFARARLPFRVRGNLQRTNGGLKEGNPRTIRCVICTASQISQSMFDTAQTKFTRQGFVLRVRASVCARARATSSLGLAWGLASKLSIAS